MINKLLGALLTKRNVDLQVDKGKFLILYCLLLAGSLSAQGTRIGGTRNTEIEIENCARINTKLTEFGPAIYKDELVFLARPKRGAIDPVSRQTYFKLFRASLSADGVPGYPKRFSVELNSNYNEGPVSFTQDDRVIYFTRTQLRDGATIEDGSGTANLGIYSAYRAQYDWADIQALPFNGKDFSNQHPSLSPDGRRIFFASNRSGGYGGYDLYFADYRDGRWSEAINLGPEINTEGNEAFPYIHPNGRLFFASDGHGGLGGYDLYLMDLSQRRWGKLINLPAPINSLADDVGISLDKEGRRGYIVSNREGGKGKDDIYLLKFSRGFASLQGPDIDGAALTVYDGSNSRRIAGAEVWLAEVDAVGRLPASFYSFRLEEKPTGRLLRPMVKPLGMLQVPARRTDREGSVRLELAVGKTYEVSISKPGYSPETLRFVFTAEGPSRPLDLILQPTNCTLLSGRITDNQGSGTGKIPLQFRPQNCPAARVTTMTDLAGYYQVCLPTDCDYLASAGRPGFETVTQQLTSIQLQNREHPHLDFQLRPEGMVARRGTEADEGILPLPGISFYGKTAILQEALSSDVDLLETLLRQRLDLRLLLVVHTDGPEAIETLQNLGQQRGEAIRQALLRRGIAAERLQTVAYGNQFRRKACVNCTPADYLLNNHVEAKVMVW
ncbi:MAG: OmpA family protein [Bacteroidota bacterium]